MKKFDLNHELEPIKSQIPLNYFKARPVFFSNEPADIKKLIKFIRIDNLSTDFAVVSSPGKPISKCLELIQKNEPKTF